jgi:hypothetical protein
MRWLCLIGLLFATSAHAKLACGPSTCSDPTVVAAARAAVREACPCGDARSGKTYKQCWKPVVRQLARERGGVLRFDPAPAALAAVEVGTVLVGGVGPATPAGFLRVVLAVERDVDVLVLRTAQAPIQLAYRKLDVRFVRSLLATPPRSNVTTATRSLVEATKPFDFALFDGDGSAITTNDRIAIKGLVGGGFDASRRHAPSTS